MYMNLFDIMSVNEESVAVNHRMHLIRKKIHDEYKEAALTTDTHKPFLERELYEKLQKFLLEIKSMLQA